MLRKTHLDTTLPRPQRIAEHPFTPTRIVRPVELVQLYARAFSIGTLRQWLFFAAHSPRPQWAELGDCVIRIGHSVFIDANRFDKWLADWRGKFEPTGRSGRPPRGRGAK